MCNRYRGSDDLDAIRSTFDVRLAPDTGRLPNGELFPKRLGYVVRKESGERVLAPLWQVEETGWSRR